MQTPAAAGNEKVKEKSTLRVISPMILSQILNHSKTTNLWLLKSENSFLGDLYILINRKTEVGNGTEGETFAQSLSLHHIHFTGDPLQIRSCSYNGSLCFTSGHGPTGEIRSPSYVSIFHIKQTKKCKTQEKPVFSFSANHKKTKAMTSQSAPREDWVIKTSLYIAE